MQTKIFAAQQRIRQTAEIHKEQIDNYRNKHELMQAQYNTAIEQHQHIVPKEKQK